MTEAYPIGDEVGAEEHAKGLTSEWQISSYSGTGATCVEPRLAEGDGVQVRDSKDPEGPKLTFSVEAWQGLLAGLALGEMGAEL